MITKIIKIGTTKLLTVEKVARTVDKYLFDNYEVHVKPLYENNKIVAYELTIYD